MTAPTPSRIASGEIIAETYRVTRLIGKGGMGAVWEAEHVRLPGKHVAIKVLSADFATDPETLARFRREAEIASRLNHPNIVTVHDYNTLPDDTPYLVLELLHGESLDSRLFRGPLPWPVARTILEEVCAALRTAHRGGVVHRDLKPQNVFLCTGPDGEPGPAKILDFGISKLRGSSTVKTQTSTVLGTPQYMSPEQALGKHDEVDHRTDIFCLGIMAFEMLAGQAPFTGQTVPEVVFKIVYEPEPRLAELSPNLAAEVIETIHRALAKKREDRWSTVDEFAAALGLRTASTSQGPVGDTGVDVLAETAASGKSSLPEVGLAQTVQSGVTPAAAVAAATTKDEGAARSRRSTWMLIAALLFGASVATAISLALVRSGREDRAEKRAERRAERAAERKSDRADERRARRAQRESETEPQGKAPSAHSEVEATAVSEPRGDGKSTKPRREPTKPPPSPSQPEAAAEAKPATDAGATATEPSEGDGESSSAPFPSRAQLSRMPAGARDKLVEARRLIDEGDYGSAALRAVQAKNEGGGDVATAVGVIARCMQQDPMNAQALSRQISRPALLRRLVRFCDSRGVSIGE